MNVMSVSLLRLANGDLGIFYLLRLSWHDTAHAADAVVGRRPDLEFAG
jgi:hypothetical protein